MADEFNITESTPAGVTTNTQANQASGLLDTLEAEVAHTISGRSPNEQTARGGEIVPGFENEAQREQAQREAGQELAVQLERQREAFEQQLRLVGDQHNQQLGAMTSQINTLSSQLANVQNNIPANRELSPAEKHALTPEELVEVENQMPAIQKIAAMKAEEQVKSVTDRFETMLDEQQKQFEAKLKTFEAAQTLQTGVSENTFRTLQDNTAAQFGLGSVSQLSKDPSFQQFLNQQESPYSQRNLHQVITDAEQRMDINTISAVLRNYAQHVASSSGGANNSHGLAGQSGVPAGNGMGNNPYMQTPAQKDPAEERFTQLENQRQQLAEERRRLNSQMAQRTITPDEFRAQTSKLQALENQVINALQTTGS